MAGGLGEPRGGAFGSVRQGDDASAENVRHRFELVVHALGGGGQVLRLTRDRLADLLRLHGEAGVAVLERIGFLAAAFAQAVDAQNRLFDVTDKRAQIGIEGLAHRLDPLAGRRAGGGDLRRLAFDPIGQRHGGGLHSLARLRSRIAQT